MEVCVDSIISVEAAVEGGADRLEVCSCLASGGLTPSSGLLQTVRTRFSDVKVFAMIRPRSGDFCYAPSEIDQMKQEILLIKKDHLADGFAMGLLLRDGTVDENNCKELLAIAAPLPVTFHRAFDLCCDPFAAIDTIASLGFSRILTSGQQPNAETGIECLRMLVEKAGDRVIIMPGCGVNHMNLETILRETKAKEFHSSASTSKNSTMEYRKETVSLGKESNEYGWSSCNAHRALSMLEVAKRFHV